MHLRPYQQDAVNACYKYLREHNGNPAIVCPTGAGKSVILAQICSDAVSLWNGRVLVLAHVKELLEQNADKVRGYLGDDLVGVYSAGLNRRDTDHSVLHAAVAVCPECGFEFPKPERQKHQDRAATAGILTGQVEDVEYKVYDTRYSLHTKRNAEPGTPPTLRVEYELGFRYWQSEWICFEHTGFARAKAEAWWKARSNEPAPDTVEQALALIDAGALAATESVTVRSISGEKYDRIIKHVLGPKPPLLDGSDEKEDCVLPEHVWPGDDIPF